MMNVMRVRSITIFTALVAAFLSGCAGGGGGAGGGALPPPHVFVAAATTTNPPASVDPNPALVGMFPPIATTLDLSILPGADVYSAMTVAADLTGGATHFTRTDMWAADTTVSSLIGRDVNGKVFNFKIFDTTGALNLSVVGNIGAEIRAADVFGTSLITVVDTTNTAGIDIVNTDPATGGVNWTYQSFGDWGCSTCTKGRSGWFSTGVPTATALPAAGTATYSGMAKAGYIDAAGAAHDVHANMSATADFATRTIAFSTTATQTAAVNYQTNAVSPPVANNGLNMTGNLTYAAGSNTFAGPVTTANGLAGEAVGRFYGPGIAVATPSKVVGSPPEIGGTFSVGNATSGMFGAFGGN